MPTKRANYIQILAEPETLKRCEKYQESLYKEHGLRVRTGPALVALIQLGLAAWEKRARKGKLPDAQEGIPADTDPTV